MARSTQLLGGTVPTKWNSRTIRMAKPRTPSSTGKCPRRLGRGLSLAGTGSCAAGGTLARLNLWTGPTQIPKRLVTRATAQPRPRRLVRGQDCLVLHASIWKPLFSTEEAASIDQFRQRE